MLKSLQSLQAVLLGIIALAGVMQTVQAYSPKPLIPPPLDRWEYQQLEVPAQYAPEVQQKLSGESALAEANFSNRPKSYQLDTAQLNRLGAEGWELVGVLGGDESVAFRSGAAGQPQAWVSNTRPAKVTLLFKRPMTGEAETQGSGAAAPTN